MKVFVYDPTAGDPLSRVRGVGRYLQILRENFPNFIFTNEISNVPFESIFINPFINFTQSPVIKKRIAKKQIAVIHDLIVLKYPDHFPLGLHGKLNAYSNKKALKNYDLIVTDSHKSKADIVEMLKVKGEKVEVVYPALPKIFANRDTRITNRTKGSYAIYVGDATWNKNLVNLASAIKEANVTCVFIGKVFSEVPKIHPWQAELIEFLRMTRNDKRFIFPGFVSDKQLLEYYRLARCNLLLSRDEGFGFSYFEAASQGIGSLLSDIPVFKETAKGGAVYADPENVSDIANKLIEIYFDSKKQKLLGEKAKQRVSALDPKKFQTAFLRLV